MRSAGRRKVIFLEKTCLRRLERVTRMDRVKSEKVRR